MKVEVQQTQVKLCQNLKQYSDGGADSPTTDLEESSKVKRKDTASVRVTTYNNLDISDGQCC